MRNTLGEADGGAREAGTDAAEERRARRHAVIFAILRARDIFVIER